MKIPATYWPTFLFGLVALAATAYLSVTLGPTSPDPQFSLYHIRLPRFVTATMLGASLALAGSLLQLATKNPLSEPELLGVNQSAVFAVVLLLLATGGQAAPGAILLSALLGSSVSGIAILFMTSSGAFPRERLILAGLTMAFFFGSASSGLLLLKETNLFELLHWTAGKVSGANWQDATLTFSALVLCLVLSLFRASQWNVLQLGDEGALNLGVDPVTRRIEIVTMSIALTAICVAVAGPIGFVGIVVPHLSQICAGLDYRRSLPLTLVLGGLLVALSDLLARCLFHPVELPVGVLTALVGAPYFLYRAQKL